MIDVLVYQALTGDNLESFLKEDGSWRVYPTGALGNAGIPARPDWPYSQYGDIGSEPVPEVRDTRQVLVINYGIFVYDQPGSFLRIKTIHAEFKQNVEGLIGQVAPNGWRITDSQFRGFGIDAFDQVNQQVSKRARYTIVASRSIN